MRIVVTGGSSGLGKTTAAAFAAAGHQVTIACRTLTKGERAAAEMPGDVEVRHLDLADLSSVRGFAATVKTVDVLVNNAGVLGLPLTRTVDGFEAHMGTNYLGHFALTCCLGDKIADRVISVGSALYLFGRIDLDDLNWHRRKYAMLPAVSDPGMAYTDITRDSSGVLHWLGEHLLEHLAQSASNGARATIEALSTDRPSGTYLAPRFNQWGRPKVTVPVRKARDPVLARKLWELSAEMTGCDWAGRRS